MADNFVAMDQIFQARATLQSLIDNFPLKDVKDLAARRLREMDAAEAERKRQIEADTVENPLSPEDE
jgi:hypothetical protein